MTKITPSLTNLRYLQNLDLDKNNIEGSFPFESSKKIGEMLRLDINFNFLTGNLDFMTMFPNLKEAHLDNNNFGGTIPESLGEQENLRILTLHQNNFTGTMPTSVCRLREELNLYVLTADCGGADPKVECPCCTHCFPMLS